MGFDVTVETVPVYLAMGVIVPLTFDAIKVILEDNLDFDCIVNRKLLRFLELVIAIIIFPTAATLAILMIAYFFVRKSYKVASKMMQFLSEPCFFSSMGYLVSLVALFLSLQIVFILFLKFIYNSL